MSKEKRMVGIDEKMPLGQSLPLSLQHLTAMFGATILVPILVYKKLILVKTTTRF